LDIGKRLKLILYDYEFRGVRVVFVKDYPRLPTPGGTINVRRGDELELPRWQARMLESMGVAEISEKPLDPTMVNMYHYQEKKRPYPNALVGLPQDFYLKVREYIRRIDEAIKQDPRKVNYVLLRERETLERNLYDLAQTRLAKILRLALGGGEEFRDRMTPEESLIYSEIADVSEEWRRYIQSIFRGEE